MNSVFHTICNLNLRGKSYTQLLWHHHTIFKMLSYIMNVLMLTKCYEDYGCFSLDGNFQSVHRPINLFPLSPEEIGLQFVLYTRTTGWKIPQNLNYRNETQLILSDIQPNRDFKIIVHGYREYGNKVWVQLMIRELLKKGDFNVIVADWKNGSYYAYPQAVANARLVGVMIAKFIESILNLYNTSAESFHLIAHSLGAHIAGYAGQKLNKLGRISALDPAKPYFEDTPPEVRLDPSDANFVDIIHTDVAPMYSGGMGMYQTCGHVDFYPNGGEVQPGCSERIIDAIDQHGGSLTNGVKDFVVCKHIRSHRLFIESINTRCSLLGVACDSWAQYNNGECFDCSTSKCAQMGYNSDQFKPYAKDQSPTKMYLKTGHRSPYCRYHYKITILTPNYLKPKPGKLFVILAGVNGESSEELYLNREISFQAESTYVFVMASNYLGNLSSIVAVWKHSTRIWDPYTWHLMSKPTLEISFIRVDNLETSSSWVTCSIHGLQLLSQVPETINISTNCNYDLQNLIVGTIPAEASRFRIQQVCYDDIGCFNNDYPFFDPAHGRYVSLVPQSPKKIHVQYLLYTRENAYTPHYIIKYDLKSVSNSSFNPNHPTKMIVHGFLDNGLSYWIKKMVAGFLNKEDCNVISVDWSGGNFLPYTQATANTRVVGAEIASMWTWMEDFFNATRESLHLLGHSLGAHTVGYAGERLQDVPHITGLDPAGPLFEFTQPQVRLDPSDAKFVESIHTDGNGVYGFGFGMMTAISHFDYYPNSGKIQAGCKELHLTAIWKDGIDEGIRKIMSCSHQRACDLYVDSMSEPNCPFFSHECDSWENFINGNCTSCGEDGSLCVKLGYNSLIDNPMNVSSSLYRKFYSVTAPDDPYCYYHFHVRIELHAESELDNTSANFYIKACNKFGLCTANMQLTQRYIGINKGQVLEFVMAQPINISPVKHVDFQWDSDKFSDNLYIILKKIEIIPMDERPESTRLYHQRYLCSESPGEKIKPGQMTTLMANATC